MTFPFGRGTAYQHHVPPSNSLFETALTIQKPHDVSGEFSATKRKTHMKIASFRGAYPNA